ESRQAPQVQQQYSTGQSAVNSAHSSKYVRAEHSVPSQASARTSQHRAVASKQTTRQASTQAQHGAINPAQHVT
ncbi:unnamed protein product, partial [Laminaria digitata]